MKLAVAICLLAGCDVMFKLKPLDDPPDATDVDVLECGTPDEDGDCIADDVDNCPGIANASQIAMGEANVPGGAGDACDPDPSRSGNIIKRFWGFNDPAIDDPDWENQFGGGWMFTSGYVANAGLGNYGYLQHVAIDDDDDLTIEARFIYHSYDPNAPATEMAVLLDKPTSSTGGQACWVTPHVDQNFVRLYAQESTEAGGESIAVDLPPLTPGTAIVIQMRRDRVAGVLYCAAIIEGTRVDLPPVAASGPWLTMGHAVLQSRAVATDATYVTLYSR